MPTPAPRVPFSGATDTYNYAAVNALMTPNERWQITALGDHDLIDSQYSTVSAYGELSYTKRTSHQRLAPDASFSVTDFNGQPNELVPASNPFNPFGDTPNNPWGVSGEDVLVNRRFVESGGRLFSQNTDTYRMVTGFEGSFSNGIDWDLSYTYADNQETYETNFYHRFDRWATIVDPALCSADPACVAATGPENALNPFADYGSISAEEIGYVMANSLKDSYETHMTTLALSFSGDFAELQGGPVGWAAGLEQRSERARIIPDEFSASGLTTGGALDPLKGSYEVQEAYVEFILPVLAGQPFAKSLDIEASARYSDYNTSAGDTNNYRLGADWAINDDFRVRSVYSTGFRAPNMVEYFTQAVTFPISENYCEFTDLRNDINATAKANCAALNYAGDYEQGFQYQAVYSQTAAAENLGPEESTSLTAGVVWTPQAIEELQISIDWYSIEIDDYIGLPDYNLLVKTCLESVGFSAPACAAFPGGTGILDGNVDGIGDDASITLGNLGKVETSGIDIAAQYRIPVDLGVFDSIDLSFAASYLDEAKSTFALTGSYDVTGTAGSQYGTAIYPEWRWNSSIGLSGEAWRVQWLMNWLDETSDFYRPANITDDATAEDVLYHDLVGTFAWNTMTVSVGLDNVLDEEPPEFHSGFNMRTAPASTTRWAASCG
ncbi:MAG: TonB-dependent receptor [Gammaproteobacteria bacterium]|nr:TonB-dependent receptor [Gammaproteobacteria bacterium]